eukprot:35808_1
MMFILSAIALALLSYVALSESCFSFDSYSLCVSQPNGVCVWVPLKGCECNSPVELDILFAIDTSIDLNNFDILKSFMVESIIPSINQAASKIGFAMFSTHVNFSRSIQLWETQPLTNYISGLHRNGGHTNTPEVIKESIAEFAGSNPAGATNAYVPDPARQQILVLITDGNPCMPGQFGGCPLSVCQYRTQINEKGIRVIIISVGNGLNEQYLKCLTQTDEDFMPVESFSFGAFYSIMGSLSDALCPIAIQFKVTEAKAMRKPSSWSNTGDARFTRFIEIYNTGIDFNLNA